jgi:hypothetical protein
MAPTDLVKLSDEPGHSTTSAAAEAPEAEQAPVAHDPSTAGKHPLEMAADDFAAAVKREFAAQQSLHNALVDEDAIKQRVLDCNAAVAKCTAEVDAAHDAVERERKLAGCPSSTPPTDED